MKIDTYETPCGCEGLEWNWEDEAKAQEAITQRKVLHDLFAIKDVLSWTRREEWCKYHCVGEFEHELDTALDSINLAIEIAEAVLGNQPIPTRQKPPIKTRILSFLGLR